MDLTNCFGGFCCSYGFVLLTVRNISSKQDAYSIIDYREKPVKHIHTIVSLLSLVVVVVVCVVKDVVAL